MKNKKIIVLNHNGGQLANQLWNYMSIYAYCLHKGFECRNYCFFEYGQYFSIPVSNTFIDFIFFRSFPIACRIFSFEIAKKIWRKAYKISAKLIKMAHPISIIYSRTTRDSLGTYLLPPSYASKKELHVLEEGNSSIYFDGWLFRNPKGIIDYRSEIIEHLKPRAQIRKGVREIMSPLRHQFALVIGIHIRQGDYKEFKGGRFFIEQQRVRQILNEYIQQFKVNKETTCFVVCSNGEIDFSCFNGLNMVKSGKNFIEDLFILASCDLIIGSDSTFGSFASYYGNIPHIVFKKEPIDWEYYQGQNGYFENKYCLTACNDPSLWSGY